MPDGMPDGMHDGMHRMPIGTCAYFTFSTPTPLIGDAAATDGEMAQAEEVLPPADAAPMPSLPPPPPPVTVAEDHVASYD